MTTGEGAAPTPRHGRIDVLLIFVLFAIALWPRVRGYERYGLVNYDEGVYSESADAVRRGAWPEELHPQQQLHSPPFTVFAGGFVARAFDWRASRALIALNAFLGALTASLLFLLVRPFAGRAAGAAAGLMLAFNEPHVLVSRSAMTDVPFLFWFVAALIVGAAAERRRSLAWAAFFGLLTGVALNTKYHGFLALGVVGMGAVPQFFDEDRRGRRAMIARFAIAGLIAAACAVPWRLHVATLYGGNSAVAGQHSRFIHAAHWLPNAGVQLGIFSIQTGLVALAGTAIAFVLGWIAIRRTRNDPSARTVLSGFLVFSILTPLYHPYPRLLTPWIALVLATAGAAVAKGGVVRRSLGVAAVAAAAFGPMIEEASFGRIHSSIEPADELERAVLRLLEKVPKGAPLAILSEPTINSIVREAGHEAARLGYPRQIAEAFPDARAVYVISGYFTRRTKEWRTFEQARGRPVAVIASEGAATTDLRRLEDGMPHEVRLPAAYDPRTYGVELRLLDL